jgi:hypothetical protein
MAVLPLASAIPRLPIHTTVELFPDLSIEDFPFAFNLLNSALAQLA